MPQQLSPWPASMQAIAFQLMPNMGPSDIRVCADAHPMPAGAQGSERQTRRLSCQPGGPFPKEDRFELAAHMLGLLQIP